MENSNNYLTAFEALIDPKNIPRVDLAKLLDEHNQLVSLKQLGRGSTGIVLKIGNQAAKIGFKYDLPDNLAERISALVHPDDSISRKLLTRKLAGNVTRIHSFEKQALAHILGHKITPDLIDDQVSLLESNHQDCGMLLPFYEGDFVSISDPKFEVNKSDLQKLYDAGIHIDDFVHRNNGVILSTGERRIIDMEFNPKRANLS